MSFSKLKQNICRICLKQKVNLNWDDEILEFCGISYRDCYYKYTKLEDNGNMGDYLQDHCNLCCNNFLDPDSYPTNLCEKCADDLKNAHILFEKALDSFKILQGLDMQYFNIDMDNNSPSKIKNLHQISDVGNVDDKTLIQTEENHNFSTLHANEKNSKFGARSHGSIKSEMSEDSAVDSTHFIDIHNFESTVEMPFEEHFGELCNTEAKKSLTTQRIRSKRKKVDTISLPTAEENEASDTSTLYTKKKRKRNKCDVLLNDDKLCIKPAADFKNSDIKAKKEVGTKDVTSLENLDTNSTKPAKKSREKYLFMCSYCSLKVDGAKKLEKHEATHNENRERTVICPECGLKLYTDWSLNIHMKIHDTNRQKNHKCEFCEKAFFNKGALNVHRRIHLGLMIKCQICEKEFFRQVDLDKHLLKHSASPLEKNVGKKIYAAQCQYCNKSILTDKLKEHIAIHLNQPQVKCKICDKNFYSRKKCTNHLRRFHLKKLSEYEDFIHYYVDRNKRLSSLMIKQQLVVQSLK